MGSFNSTFGVFTTFSNDINKQKKQKQKTNNEETIGNGNKYKNKIKTRNFSQSIFTLLSWPYLQWLRLLVAIIVTSFNNFQAMRSLNYFSDGFTGGLGRVIILKG